MYMSAATAARPEPIAKVVRTVLLTLMPMSMAALLSSDTQRMARPILVFCVKIKSSSMTTALTAMV